MSVYNKNDSYYNTITGLGKSTADKTESTSVLTPYIFSDQELTDIYTGDGLGGKIVDVVPNDGTRNGWTYRNDFDEKIKNELKRLGFKSIINQAWKLARLYRGAIIAMVTENGKLELPIPTNGGKITRLKVYSAARIQNESIQATSMHSGIIDDPNSEYYDDFELFEIMTYSGNIIKIHRDRCAVIKGIPAPDYNASGLDIKYRYWGYSVIQRIWDKLQYYGTTEQGVANIMQEVVIGKYKLADLRTIMSMNKKEALDKIITRMEAMNLSKSILNAVLIGEGDDYSRDSVSMAGVPETIDRMMMNLSAVSEIPVTRLFGRSPAGENATGQSDERIYYDGIHSTQENKLQCEMDKIIKYVASYIYPGVNSDEFGIEKFNSLWELTEKEQAEINKIKSEMYNNYIMSGVLTAEDVQEIEFPELNNE